MSVSDAYNFREVSDRVHTAGLLSEDQLRALGAERYAVLVNLLPDDSEYAIPGEKTIVEGQGLAYHHLPVDFAAPTADDYRDFEELIAAAEGEKTLIHCAANYRVSAFYALYAFRHLGWSEERARDFVASVWDLEDHPVWKQFFEDAIASDPA